MLTVSFPLSSEIVICPFEISDFIFSIMFSYVELTFWTCSSLAFTRLAFSALSFAFSASRSATFLRSSEMDCERLSDFDRRILSSSSLSETALSRWSVT